jgi:hypothetical protein
MDMDSACPFAQRNAGQPTLDSGLTFILANGTKNAENTFAFDWLGRDLAEDHSYRDTCHQSALGYGHAA